MTREVDAAPPSEPLGKSSGPLPQPGDRFDGKYRIERMIGLGAMAAVFEATHLQLEDRVAIKLLLPRQAERPELVDRFMREGRAATRIRSEHVVRVFDVGVAGSQPYLVMEYLDGRDLDQVLEQEGPLAVPVAVDYLLQACEAIAEAHARGIVHRDLKPANLFLTRRADGSACVKVLDFGISKLGAAATPDVRTTEPAEVMGSPHYMSPEQMLSSTDVDARSDVWSLGAILHELVVGAPAFNAETIAALSASVLRDPPPRLTTLRADVPPRLEEIVLRCLDKEPARRFADVAELASALAELGTPAARASAERIARVLEGGQGGAVATSASPSVEPMRAAALLVDPATPARPRGRVAGYVVAAAAVVGIGACVVSMVVKDQRSLHASVASELDAAPPVSSLASAGASATTLNATVDATPPAPSASAEDRSRGKRAGGAPLAPSPSASPSPVARPPVRRTPRHPSPPRDPRTPPLPDFPVPSAAVPPLPDFPVPSAAPEGEPSSRPILTAPAASPSTAPPPALPTAPPPALPTAPAPAASAPPTP